MAGQPSDRNAGSVKDRVSEKAGAGAEGNILSEVLKTPHDEQLKISREYSSVGKEAPELKSADGKDLTVEGPAQEKTKESAKAADREVQVGAVAVREGFAPGVDSMVAVKARAGGEAAVESAPEKKSAPGPDIAAAGERAEEVVKPEPEGAAGGQAELAGSESPAESAKATQAEGVQSPVESARAQEASESADRQASEPRKQQEAEEHRQKAAAEAQGAEAQAGRENAGENPHIQPEVEQPRRQ